MPRRNGKLREYTYPVLVEPLEEGGYLATCPSLPGCHAEGRTRDEALDIVADVMRIFIEEAQASGHEPPPAVTSDVAVVLVKCAA